ncbi:MAG TPA: SIMPL domain-containing protein [Thermoanaerobaculia bacterium]|nr:SIMPL domain-containing protein [Thermoanaerobaculia bacterium]
MHRERFRFAVPALLLAALLLPVLPAAAQAHPPAPPPGMELRPSITVSGSGEVKVEPDQAVVRLGVVAQAETARAAQDQVNRAANQILAAIARLGIPEAAIQTERLMLHPVYAERNPRTLPQGEYREPEIVAYRASNVVSVRVDDLSRVGPVIDAGIGAGANQVEGVDFRLRDDTGARRQALTRAVADGRQKAEAIAGALGVALGGVVQADESGVNTQYPVFDQAMYARAEMAASAPTPVAPGEITVHANVTLRYLIAGGR